ncbi:MAG: ABC transporter ATP-binding protein [Acetivibrionales bacterium]|jgi:ABC-2 type transport system ATP-binding protein|nr:ABC transporter ATP-binding protein [Clostridiaceae bacterium]HOA56105.1 ABC transporter ATP-binding protein [Clostridiales bacterium]HPZ06135.1 ABC transporter ATP-binding protein [Clostridiales bacterium]HQD32072.1 ABC transporter ATP-binding protein [Clostridiales bacterium]
MNDNVLLETISLTKRYKDVTALKDFSVKLKSNKIYGLLGRNGAGKTTLLDTVTSRIFPDSGNVRIFGQDATENQQILPLICYMPEKNYFIPTMRVSDILKVSAMFYENFDMGYADQLCVRFGLDKRKKYKTLSRGYESILRIVIGLASRAPLTIFDEPVLGLDAAVRDLFYRELLEDYTNNPRTYIVSTHLIEESADVFEDVLIIKEGQLITQLQVSELKEMAFYMSGKPSEVDAAVSGLNVIHSEMVGSVKISAVFSRFDDGMKKNIRAHGVDISPIPIQKLFIYLTNSNREGMQ